MLLCIGGSGDSVRLQLERAPVRESSNVGCCRANPAYPACDAYRPKVVFWVLAGGVFAAVLGPKLIIFTKDLLPRHLFAASYLGQSVCALAAAIVLQFVKVPPLGQAPHTSAPLAMVGCGHSVTDAALGIQWHVLAMYAPSFVTGAMIARFGIERITGIGLA
jgi:hypothetical protein